MEVTILPKDISERFQSDTRINNFTQCILELIFNSLDAKATSIAIRVNITKHQVQVIDNGQGITLNDLHNVGIRYMTSKCESLHMYENKHKFYGYKGETLASIISVSEQLVIVTRSETDELTYTKTFEHSDLVNITPSKTRYSKGTTVIVKKLFNNCPVKLKRISNNIDLNNIKVLLQSLAVIHPHVSFSLRDDTSGKIILNCCKMKTVSKSFCAMFRDISCKDLIDIKISKGNIYVSGLIYTKLYKNCKPQLMYVNKRPVNIDVIAKYIKETLSQILINRNETYPVFVVNISCPYSEIDILYDTSNILIEFRSYEVVLKCVEKMMNQFRNKCGKINLSNYEMNYDIRENTMGISKVKDELETEVKREELLSNVKIKGNIVRKQSREEAFAKSIRKMKRIKKTLGLRKTKFALKKKQINIFEKSTDLSTLSYQDFPSNMPLKKENLENGFYCLKDMVDEHLDSRNSAFGKKTMLQNSLAGKELVFEDATTGKEIVMDLFLKSLTSSLSQPHLQVEPQQVCEAAVDNVSSERSMLSIKTYSRDINLSNDKNEIHENKKTKRHRMEKLNRIGTSLIENKLLQVNGLNINDKSAQTDSLTISKKSKSVGTSPDKKGSTLRRTFSEDKSIQTSFIQKDLPKVESIGIQTSFYVTHDLKLPAETVTIKQSLKNATQNTTEFNLFHPTSQQFNFENNIENINIFQSNQDNHNSNNITFVSHYNLKLRQQSGKIQETPHIEVDTKDALTNLSTMVIKEINKVDNKCKVFENIIGNEANNATYQSPTKDVTFNIDYGNTSIFFEIKSNKVAKQCIKRNKNTRKHEYNFSVLLDTSDFFEKHENDEMHPTKMFKFNNLLESGAIFDESCNQTITSFKHFMPPIQSTQKEKYGGKIHNFFESFLFDDYKGIDTHEINTDNSIIQNVYEEVNNNNLKNCINQHEMQQLDSERNMYHTNKKTGTSIKNDFCGESIFLLKKRTDFIPKGLSPILQEINNVNLFLSPSSKKKLNNAIIETYENELELIKWQEYIDKQDPSQFFNTLYTAKNQQIEQNIPNTCPRMVKKVFPLNTTYSFTKDIFTKLDILGQLDNKFIVVLHNSTLIILLDQHAVHERIRVEKLLNDYTLQTYDNDRIIFKSVQCKEPFIINYTNTEIQILKSFRVHFEALGLFFEIYDTFIKIKKIPLCLANKCARDTNTEETLSKFTNNLINDELYILQSTRGILSNIPKIIQYAINNEACRGAIKFGKKLTPDECCKYITDLSKCRLPFQCAHGRPTLYPILEICSNEIKPSYNLRKLRQIF